MVGKILLLSASVALSANHSASAACMDDMEMHGNTITGLTSPEPETIPGSAANRDYVDDYVAELDQNRNNGTVLSPASTITKGDWFKAQKDCNELVAPANEAEPDKTYDDWHLPSRVEWISACLHHGSKINYAEQSWTADGLCAGSSDSFWTRDLHTGPVAWLPNPTWDVVKLPLDKYEFFVTGTAETFSPATGNTMRISPVQERQIRCIR